VRAPKAVKREIQLLSARRLELWRAMGEGREEARRELHEVSAQIDELWLELRHAAARLRAGSPEAIVASARRAERAERELKRRVLL
jgi:hypothetical protein